MDKDMQLQSVDLNQLQQIGEFGVAELMTMKETIGKDLSMPQFNLFMYQCNRMGLDPALKHAWPILYGGKMDSRISYEGYLSLAKKSEGFEGVYNQVVCDNETDDFEAETDDEGVITRIHHKVKFPRGKVVGAYSIAKREGKKSVIILMDNIEVIKHLKGQNQKFWKMEDGSPDPDMFKKHVGTRSIKGQYDIASVVEENMESMNESEAASSYTPTERRDITAEVEATAAKEQPKKQPATASAEDGPKPLDEEQPDPDAEKIVAIRAEVAASFEKLGIMSKEERAIYLKDNAKVKGEKPTLAEYKALLKIMKMQIEDKEFAEAERAAAGEDEPALELE